MENRGKSIFILMNWFLPKFCLVTVYTQFGYASVDLEKYKNEF